MHGLWHDIRLALRSLRQQQGLSLAALLSLALGIGANTALFSVAYGVLLRPLPYPEADRLVRLAEEHPGAAAAFRGSLLTDSTYRAWSEGATTLEGIAAFGRGAVIDTTGDRAVRLESAAVSPSLFPLLRARPVVGRLLVADDAREGAPPVAVISDGLYRERFADDPAAVGSTLFLDGKAHTIVGVAPPGFDFPDGEPRLWTPFRVQSAPTEPGAQSIQLFGAVGRLAPGASVAQAAAEGTAAARSVERPPIADAIFGQGGPVKVRVRTILDEMTATVRPALLVLSVGIGFVLLICCANVANLLLSRGVSRERELAVRTSLGASRWRVLRQVVTESLVLSLVGGALGLGLCGLLLAVLPEVAPADFPRLDDVALDSRAVLFAALAVVASGLLAGLTPALRAARRDPLPALREGAGASAGARTMRLGTGLLVAEAALAVMLLVAAGLLLHSFAELVAVDPGYDPGNVLVAQVYVGGEPDEDWTRQLALDLVERTEALPGVEVAGASNMAPLSNATAITQFDLPPAVTGGEPITARAVSYTVTPGYAEALSLRLVAGRFFVPEDLGRAIRPLLVNEELVRAYLSDGRPVVGRRFDFGRGENERPTEIVGVVGNVLKDGLDAAPQSELYSLPQDGPRIPAWFYLVVRTGGDPQALVAPLLAVAGELAPAAALEVATLSSRLSDSVSQARFAAATLASVALLAVALAAIGLYGVLSYNLSRRRRELGVRGALGADRGAIVRLVLRQGLLVTAAGLALGLAGAAALARLLASLLFGVTPLDPVAFAAAPVLLLAVAAGACLLPAWRAASVPPTEALRGE
jgi:putative ABC transport system permease protein